LSYDFNIVVRVSYIELPYDFNTREWVSYNELSYEFNATEWVSCLMSLTLQISSHKMSYRIFLINLAIRANIYQMLETTSSLRWASMSLAGPQFVHQCF
jgi:hypothetical protein